MYIIIVIHRGSSDAVFDGVGYTTVVKENNNILCTYIHTYRTRTRSQQGEVGEEKRRGGGPQKFC